MQRVATDPKTKSFAKDLYSRGLSTSKIAKQTGVNSCTINAWIRRDGWKDAVKSVTECMQLDSDSSRVDAGKRYLDKIDRISNKALNALEKEPIDGMKKIKQVLDAVRVSTDIGKVAYNLNPEAKQPLSVNVLMQFRSHNIGASDPVELAKPVFDSTIKSD